MSKGPCTICGVASVGRGLCNKHYLRLLRHGDPHHQRPSLADRLNARLVTSSNTYNNTACLEWTGAKLPKGYGKIGVGGRGEGWLLTHRVAWELSRGPIADDQTVCHRCDNPPCCNVDHLFLGTIADNNRDMIDKGRAVVFGKPYTP